MLLQLFFIILQPAYSQTGFENTRSVAILGDAVSDHNSRAPFNEEVLGLLFDIIRSNSPSAVFFTGNLTDIRKSSLPAKAAFKEQLNMFTVLQKNELEFGIPFFPILGNLDALLPNAASIFRQHFNLKNVPGLSEDQLIYTVSVGDAFFVALSTDYYDQRRNVLVEHQISSAVLTWLENELKTKSDFYRYLFVLGHDPAFSTTASLGEYKGLDQYPEKRNRFWKILKDNHVLAYFCSHEHLYDRSFRDGVWQIVSGGAGAPLNRQEIFRAFYHFLLLSIPSELGQVPVVKVIDLQRRVRDEFPLTSTVEPIYQLRISKE